MLKYYISLLLLIHLSASAQQSLRFKRLNVNDGLSQNTVISIVQDRNGFMWLSTQDGLNRYDGYSFKIYRYAENDSNSLSNNYVMCLAADKKGNVWAGTTNGLNRIDGRTGRLTRINLKHLVGDATNYRIHAIAAADNGNVYFGMNWGIFYADTAGKIHGLKNFNDHKLAAIELFAQRGILWAGTYNSILSYDLEADTISGTAVTGDRVNLVAVSDTTFIYKRAGLLYRHNLRSHADARVYSAYINPSITRNCVSAYTGENEQWLSTTTGLIWQRGSDTLLIKHFADYEFSLSSDYVYCVFKDRSGLYWIGTSRGGLCIFNPAWQHFKVLGKPSGVNAAVWNITEKNDTLIVATTKGIKMYRRNKGIRRISDQFLPEQALTEIRFPGLQEQLKDLLISSVCTDVNGNLWLGTENNGALQYHFRKNKITRFSSIEKDSGTLCSNNVLYLERLSDSTMGVCSSNGFSIIHIRSHKIKRVYLSLLDHSLTNNYILKSFSEGDHVWLSSANGLCRYDLRKNRIDQFLPDKKNIAEQYHNMVSDFKTDNRNRYWASTLGYGILNLDPGSGQFTRFGASAGLKNESVLGMLADNNGGMWLGTHEGIAKFDTEKKQFETFDVNEGMDSKECTINGFYKSSTGDLFFGTVSSLMIFNPDSVRPHTGSCKTVLTGIKINYSDIENNSEYISGSNFCPSGLQLDHRVKTISFEFAALDFLNADNVSYKYKLAGFNDSWVKVNAAERNAIYTNLPPKTYTFSVIPVLNGKEEPGAGLSFVVRVSPPFWRSWWFILISLLGGIMLVVLAVRYYYQRQLREELRKAEEERKLQREKERISRELHDNVGSQLTYIIKSLDNLSYKSENEAIKIAQHLDALSDFSRDTLNQLRESIWAINSKVIPLSELLGKIHEYVNKINGSFDNTRISLESSYHVNTELKPTVAINSFRILQEAVINSLKYADASVVEVTIIQRKDLGLEFIIRDNGKGFELHNGKGKGYGLENMRSRAREMESELVIASGTGKGTAISFATPT